MIGITIIHLDDALYMNLYCYCINCQFFLDPTGKDSKTIERANLMNVSKLLIKELIDSSLAHGRMLDDDYVPLQQFFVVLEHVLRHGLKRKLYIYCG